MRSGGWWTGGDDYCQCAGLVPALPWPGTAGGHPAAGQGDPADTGDRDGVDHAWDKVGRKILQRFIVIKV